MSKSFTNTEASLSSAFSKLFADGSVQQIVTEIFSMPSLTSRLYSISSPFKIEDSTIVLLLTFSPIICELFFMSRKPQPNIGSGPMSPASLAPLNTKALIVDERGISPVVLK